MRRTMNMALTVLATLALALTAMFGSGTAMAAIDGTPSEPVSNGDVTPYIIPGENNGGNRTCEEVGMAFFGDASYYELSTGKINYQGGFQGSFDPIKVTTDGTYVSWEYAAHSGLAAIVKGSSDANVYVYDGSYTSDSGLASPLNAGRKPSGLSNLTFCWNPFVPKPLTAEKTAEATYDRTVTWTLEKTVDGVKSKTFTGAPGDVFNVTWEVVATKSEEIDGYQVTGKITITNPNPIPVDFSVEDQLNDGTLADVDCPSDTVGANASIVCDYIAYPDDASATKNTATVTSYTDGVDGATAEKEFTFEENLIGYDEGTLKDPRFDYEQVISGNTTKTFPEQFTCPTDPSLYMNGNYTFTEKNTAYLNGNIKLESSAEVSVICVPVWKGETATGRGLRYPGSSNWFMYTPFTTDKVDLIAGQHYDAGDIYISQTKNLNGTWKTTITIDLSNNFRWASVAENLKIQDFYIAPTKYVQPGAFKYKFTVSGDVVTVTFDTKNPPTHYGIHADVERLVLP